LPSKNTKTESVDSAAYRERVYALVRQIPVGRVMTYGQIAYLLGDHYTPRTVGFVMHGANEENTPWHRVINAQGACSTGRVVIPADKQQRMLESEGIEFNSGGRCSLERYQWSTGAEKIKTPEETDFQSTLFKN
jgi:methylated-DNA-protein-cysteine methyltransferase-like protein